MRRLCFGEQWPTWLCFRWVGLAGVVKNKAGGFKLVCWSVGAGKRVGKGGVAWRLFKLMATPAIGRLG
jgi:hypothetical protein